MADQDRPDAAKALNNTLTAPAEDAAREGNDYPGLPNGPEQVRTGGPVSVGQPGYAAPPGRDIDPDADPAASAAGATVTGPTEIVAATDLDEGTNPGAGAASGGKDPDAAGREPGPAVGANFDPARATADPAHFAGVAPGAASMDRTNPD